MNEAVEKLAVEDPLKAELVKLRFFAGLGIPEAAEVLGISPTTAKRHWTFTRAWSIFLPNSVLMSGIIAKR